MDIKKILFRTNSIDVEKALPDAVVLCSKDGKIQWVNDVAAEIFETSKMHLLTSNISDFIENPTTLITNSIIMHKPVITKFSGKEIYFDMTAKEIEEGYVLDFRDAVSSYQETVQEEAPEVINREKNNFLLKLSNDLKAPNPVNCRVFTGNGRRARRCNDRAAGKVHQNHQQKFC